MRLLLLFFSFLSLLNAIDWDVEKSFKLKKDQIQNILITTPTSEKLLSFRWTLFKNEGLVFLYTFDDHAFQNILYQRHRSRMTKVVFEDIHVKHQIKPFLLFKFQSYDYETGRAEIVVFLNDKEGNVDLKFIPKKAK